MNGGDAIADVLARQGAWFLFTLCGGHISPILVGAKRRGIRVVDVRHEATAVFAADAVARLTGTPGVAAVTAGPGATNAVTATKNAWLAQSPVVLIGGAAATLLKGRGALQDIDQLALFRPHVKWAASVKSLREIAPKMERAFRVARSGVPGPVFVEFPVDLLYDERTVRDWYAGAAGSGGPGFRARARRWYVERHVNRLFAGGGREPTRAPAAVETPEPSPRTIARAAEVVARAQRPLLLLGSQCLTDPSSAGSLATAVERLGAPAYLSGMARGLLGVTHPLLFRHRRREALREADLVILAGTPLDFRLDYGRHLGRSTTLIAANRSKKELKKNRRPTIGSVADAARFVERLAAVSTAPGGWDAWIEELRVREREREEDMAELAREKTQYINPLSLCYKIDRALADDSVLVMDGGDFVATAAYVIRPRGPVSFLDPGVFGTLGVGAGFALGAKLCRPEAQVWILYGDGSAAYSLAEIDTFARHGIGVVAVIGNDGAWTQIQRGQQEMLEDDVATVLRRSDYESVAEGYGGRGFRVENLENVEAILAEAKETAREGSPALVNALIGTTDFRSGSMSI